MQKKILILFTLFLVQVLAWSGDLHLFNQEGDFNKDFAQSILNQDLKEGEKIFLRDRAYIYRGFLGSGNTTMILSIEDPETNIENALRLPHGNEEKNYRLSDGQRFLNYSYNGFEELEDAGIPIPKFHEYEKDAYIVVDKIAHDFTLKSFFENSESINDSDKGPIIDALKNFAKEAAIFESIGDFHLEQLVYSQKTKKWILLDWSEGHQLARLPSSPTIFTSLTFEQSLSAENKQILSEVINEIEEQRRAQAEIDKVDLEIIKNRLSAMDDYNDILNTYKEIKTKHLASFYTMLQRDFVDNQLPKFPTGVLKKPELELLLNNLGKFVPFYFSQFTEKVLANISDIETFYYLYEKLNMIGLDEELEDDLSIAIQNNIERILKGSHSTQENKVLIEKLKNDYGLINYKTKEVLGKADEYLQSDQNCADLVMSIMQAN